MERPTIGVLPLYDGDKDSYWMLPGYMKGIEDAGGTPFMLPLTSDVEQIARIADLFDGFLFTGGHDVNPELYGEKAEAVCGETCGERDAMEAALFDQVVRQDKPAFGICRGLQLFNVLLGGTLYQDIPTQLQSDLKVAHKQAPPYSKPVHPVYVAQETPFSGIVEAKVLQVNSCHHQGIKRLAQQLLPAAKAEDGLVEAAMMPDKKFVVAVQWHPEFNYKTDAPSFRLFEAFVKACKSKS
ncbi:putative glutamine amidotransferase [Cohnella sp. OV330]|uniref:gamma-glutamyl-gamma-aminobutyrate hydrolase family protein n=1 Tax=Cohnella sp. OV330 TaxID=1855288 RepID=UPI0008E715EA|nr:gamma-glutamyl-gamma-aminobutyrate hydrolase family protein [Cohnella sp. OV330]SFB04331.1 putative glutamine amidotransferase [Cohnella sp. OV330]